MFDSLPFDISPQIVRHILTTALIVAIALAVRYLATAAITRNREILGEDQRRGIAAAQNGTVAFVLLAAVFIWAPQLSTFALSLTAFAVAIVIATKEFLLCVVGSLYRAISRPFEIGDWIEIEGLRGEVLNDGLLATRVQELGAGAHKYDYTGRVLSIPNSMLLTHPVQNKLFRKNFVYHSFTITIPPERNIRAIIDALQTEAGALSAEFEETAQRYWSFVRRKTRIELPDPAPSVRIETNHLANVVLTVTMFCPTVQATQVEQKLNEHVFQTVWLEGRGHERTVIQ